MIRLNENIDNHEPKVATIGFFDGVHSGHNFLVDQLLRAASRDKSKSLVVSFANHPRLLFDPNCGLKLLTLPDEKVDLLASKGVDYCLILNFTKEFATQTSHDFIRVLSQHYGVERLIVGYDHHFGSDKESRFEDYRRFGAEFGMEIECCEPYQEHEVEPSSTKIRRALAEGDIDLANNLLGYSYELSGIVVEGKQVGRQIGFPTANISVDDLKQLPREGVYAVVVEFEIAGEVKEYKGMLNIGYRPTVGGVNRTVEVNLFDFIGNLYGVRLKLKLVKHVRDEQKFDSIQELKQQIEFDRDDVKRILCDK